jgi:hypothetical protein
MNPQMQPEAQPELSTYSDIPVSETTLLSFVGLRPA